MHCHKNILYTRLDFLIAPKILIFLKRNVRLHMVHSIACLSISVKMISTFHAGSKMLPFVFFVFTLFVGFKNKMKCERTKPGKGFGLELLHAFRLKTKKK